MFNLNGSLTPARWTVKDGHPIEAFAFWPPDIDGMLDDSLELFL